MKKLSFKEYLIIIFFFLISGSIVRSLYIADSADIETSFNETKIYFEQNASNLVEYGDLISLGVLVKMQKKLPVFVLDVSGNIITSNQKVAPGHKTDLLNRYDELINHKLPIYSSNKIAGEFIIVKPLALSIFWPKYIVGFLLILLSFVLLMLLILRTKEVNQIKFISKAVGSNIELKLSPEYSSYINLLVSSIVGYKKDILNLSAQLQDQRENDLRAQMAAQVAHDIRSPVMALSLLSSEINDLSEENRMIFNMAIDRINNISDDLLRQKRSHTPTDVISVIDSIVLEKKFQNQDKDVQFSFHYPVESQFLTNVDSGLLSRILSNIINNSIDAFLDSGIVEIALVEQDFDKIQIRVRDNGEGIPQEILSRIGSKGFTYGKKNGNGLGLFHAKKTVEDWGGNLIISSSFGAGTEIIIILPKLPSYNGVETGLNSLLSIN